MYKRQIHTQTLVELERDAGLKVAPTARAAWLTMDREGIRRLAAETLGAPTSAYRFVDTREEYLAAIEAVGLPCLVKPVTVSYTHLDGYKRQDRGRAELAGGIDALAATGKGHRFGLRQ